MAPSDAEDATERAFVALQCRTRDGVLRVEQNAVELDDALEVWRQLMRMLSGEPTVVRRVEMISLRPPLELEPAAGEVALPVRIDWLARPQDNRAIYRFLALQLAGRREFGTYADEAVLAQLRAAPPVLQELFTLAEGVRVQAQLSRAYPGCAAECGAIAARLLEHFGTELRPTASALYDGLLALALTNRLEPQLPAWVPRAAAQRFLKLVAPLRANDARASDSLRTAERLHAWLGADISEIVAALARSAADAAAGAGSEPSSAADGGEQSSAAAGSLEGSAPADSSENADLAGGLSGGSNQGGDVTSDGRAPPPSAAERLKLALGPTKVAQTYVYDEWDYTASAYRSRHCRVHELEAATDAGQFFDHSRRTHAALFRDVRREFERIRPERYRVLRGLEDGEDMDLNALTEARIEARARRSPTGRVYTARVRQTRDVATLFLLDMSASTEQPYAEPGEPRKHRIIDTLKDALVVMATALAELGDSYAIYGFSSRGHDHVEVYPIKRFDDALSSAVKARIGGISPKSGTRMGAALRHAAGKFSRVPSSSKHLILLSDGYPQDQEYGPDRRSRTYGIQDTAVALREAGKAGITPFCITVDRMGQDYLREMCSPNQYLVIDQLEELPRELPKIYRRLVLG